jgi:hypothetical protein
MENKRPQRIVRLPTALEGLDDWLYLDGDSNHSVGQYTGEVSLPTRSQEAWHVHFQEISKLREELGFDFVQLFAPSKESVYEDFYPHRSRRAAIRPIDSVLALVPPDIAALYPRAELAPQSGRFDTYDKGDTHWNAFGAAVAAEIALRRLGLDRLTPLNLEYTLKTRHGDLDSKIVGRPAGEMRELSRTNNDAIVEFDSMVHNRGRVVVTHNPRAPGGKLVIFGDSFGAHFRRALLHVFRRLVFVHANSVDAEFLRVERPDYVITEMTERFVTLPPSAPSTFRIINLLRTKLDGVPDSEKEEFKRVYQGKLDSPERHIASLFLQAFEPAAPPHGG